MSLDGNIIRAHYGKHEPCGKVSAKNMKEKHGEDRKKVNRDMETRPSTRLCVIGLSVHLRERQIERMFPSAVSVRMMSDKYGDFTG